VEKINTKTDSVLKLALFMLTFAQTQKTCPKL